MGTDFVVQIDEDRIIAYQAHRRLVEIKPVTINTELRKLRLMLNWCLRKRIIDQVPSMEFLDEPEPNTEVPKIEEFLRILEHLPKDRAILTRLMTEAGLRPSEAFRLEWSKVDLENRAIEIGHKEKLTAKTKRSNRTIQIGPGLAADLASLRSNSPFVFPGATDRSKPMDNYRKALKTAVRNSGVTRAGKPIRFTPKYGRKAFTSYQWMRGVSLELIRKQVGHSPNSRVTVKNYLHLSDESLTDAVMDIYQLVPKSR